MKRLLHRRDAGAGEPLDAVGKERGAPGEVPRGIADGAAGHRERLAPDEVIPVGETRAGRRVADEDEAVRSLAALHEGEHLRWRGGGDRR